MSTLESKIRTYDRQDNREINLRKLYVESYGCAMNFADSEVVASIMAEAGFEAISEEQIQEADAIFLNTCAIRDNAELRVWNRLKQLKTLKNKNPDLIVGVLGCMAERLKTDLLEKEQLVDIVAGPDAYRDLPKLLQKAELGERGVNVLLSREETYAEINPVKLDGNGVTSFISIMRGCDNMCSFCVVPFTRGRERSRDPHSIIREALQLEALGYKEITLLGQNVDSYKWTEEENQKKRIEEWEESNVIDKNKIVTFARLLDMVARAVPQLRIRFSTSHPKDITDEVLFTMKKYDNICNYIHLPMQAGSSRILKLMNRTYDREWFMQKVLRIRQLLPDCGISTDVITGFCTETEDDHAESLSLMQWSRFDFAYMYCYSERPGTLAARKLADDVPEDVKKRRLNEIIFQQHQISNEINAAEVGKIFKVLIEGESKKSENDLKGRNDRNTTVIFPKENYQKGQFVDVIIERATTTSLIGKAIGLSKPFAN